MFYEEEDTVNIFQETKLRIDSAGKISKRSFEENIKLIKFSPCGEYLAVIHEKAVEIHKVCEMAFDANV